MWNAILVSYDLQLEIIRLDFKSGLETLMKEKPTKAIFLGTRIGDPNAVLFFRIILFSWKIALIDDL